MYFQTGQVIFVPEWPKGEFVRFWLATFWLTKSLVCIYAFIRDSTIQSDVKRFCTTYKSEDFGSLSTVRTTCHPVRTLICPLFHPSRRCAVPSGRLDKPSIICPDDVYFHTDTSQYSIKLKILSKFIHGKIDATVRTTWIPVRTRFSLRQESQFKFNRPESSLLSSGRTCIWYGNCRFDFNRPDARMVNMEIVCWRSTVQTTIPLGPDALKPYMEITWRGHATIRTTMSHRPDAALKQEIFSAKISKVLVPQLSVWMTQVHCPDDVRTY
jgi:hypothetical protein